MSRPQYWYYFKVTLIQDDNTKHIEHWKGRGADVTTAMKRVINKAFLNGYRNISGIRLAGQPIPCAKLRGKIPAIADFPNLSD